MCFRGFDGATVPHRWAFSPFTLSLYFFVFKIALIYRFYRSGTFGLNQCLASRYRFSASLKLITFQMALRYCKAISNGLNGTQ